MLLVVALRDKAWFDKFTDRALFKQTCDAYGVNFRIVNDYTEVPTKNLILFEENGEIDLKDFEHPEDAVYLFGRTGYDIKLWFPGVPAVRIPTPYKSSLFGCVACGIVLEDRLRKRTWQSQ